ncbi:hypothetical protein [Mesorhizobium sp. INR15]|uniref:hypothetical protein n=1 Tax=Mesorhizobium sp. INR15 TaxID=2654248 RepID=UPI0018964B82|nr:hypothetical protein [Mesorhizobium sp. INR15]QPC94071.1 hypothetical protein GA829_27705 [Mesorhizobium sp. INR15]
MQYLNAHPLVTNLPVVLNYFAKRGEREEDFTVFLQDEHNLVLPGGRGIPRKCKAGRIPSMFDNGENYLVRVVNERQYKSADVVIEYNMPNIVNIRTNKIFRPAIERKIVYGPAIPFEYSNGTARTIDVMTNIINTQEPRRASLVESLERRIPGYRNIQGIYDLDALRSTYQNAKIVVNAHQTWHHHSIEEFRVLPALSQGCVVVSEDVPLRETIPYHKHVIWCRYEDIAEVTADVLANYESVFDRIHGQPGLSNLLASMIDDFENSMDAVIAVPRRTRSVVSAANHLWRHFRGNS